MAGDGLNALAYDAENRLLTNTDGVVTTYGYDSRNLRVTKASGGTTTVYIFSGGKVIAEYLNGALSSEYIYMGDQLIATHAGATLTYHHRDHLSVRVNTEGTSGAPNFGQIVGEQGHYPYGELWYSSGTTTKYLFTNYERDPESGNDYAMYRYHANRLGRFLSPDPIDGSPSNPQSLNRYAYAMNDPVNQSDPNGLCTIEVVCSLRPLGCLVYEACGRPIPRPESPPPREVFGFGFGFDHPACRGTTDCSYYPDQCKKATTASSKDYYCVGAPLICKTAGRSRTANCIRLCLQEHDKCLNVPDERFDSCEERNHGFCFAFCGLACNLL
jgi:RHS repeat-associated protein